MVTMQQLAANRANSKLGGVKTEEGKATSRQNAITHGILSKEVLIKGEDATILNDFGKKIRESYAPEGELEEMLVDRIISCYWRLRRTLVAERNAMEYELVRDGIYLQSEEEKKLMKMRNTVASDSIANILRYEAAIERSITRAMHELERLQAKRNGEAVLPPTSVSVLLQGENGFVPQKDNPESA